MNANMDSLVDKIIAEADNKVRTDLVHISSMVKKDFANMAKEVVMLYYSHYLPRVYSRTDNLKDNVVDDYLSYIVLNGHGYGAWIQFNSSNMSDYDIGSKDAVVSNFMYGIHGKPRIFTESIPAIDLMDAFQENYKSTLNAYFAGLGYRING